MAHYMLLIVEPVGQRAERGLEAGHAAYQAMKDFGAALTARGQLIGSNSLASAGARLQVRGGKPSVVDGPFAEAKEMIGGYFLLDVASREEALEIAARCPAAAWATIEIRALAPCYE